jgi:hypothetical protein
MAIILDGSNGLIIPSGSSSNPSLRATDGDTGFYFDSSNVYLTVDGSEKASFYANGLSSFVDVSATNVDATNVDATNVTASSIDANDISVNGAIQMFANGNMTIPGSLDVAGDVAFTSTGLIRFDSIEVTNGANINGLVYPTTDGATNQVLLTDGSGNISFGNKATIGEAIAMSIVFGGG